MKTYDIEVQRLKSARHDKGLIDIGADVAVQARPARAGDAAPSCLRLSVEHARTLVLLLNLAATPEDESHGVMLDALRDRLRREAGAAQLLVLVGEDEVLAAGAVVGLDDTGGSGGHWSSPCSRCSLDRRGCPEGGL